MSMDCMANMTAAEFGVLVAKALLEIQSSAAWFVFQQAVKEIPDNEDMEYGTTEEWLRALIAKTRPLEGKAPVKPTDIEGDHTGMHWDGFAMTWRQDRVGGKAEAGELGPGEHYGDPILVSELGNLSQAIRHGWSEKSLLEWIDRLKAKAAIPRPAPAAHEGLREVCVWTDDGYGDGEAWDTSCGEAFCFNDGTPEENGFKFCHHCGRPVEIKREKPFDDEEDAALRGEGKDAEARLIAGGTMALPE